MSHLKAENFSFYYPDTEEPALSDISFDIEEGSFNVLCGKSGCGKSTLLRHLKQELAPYGRKEGRLFFSGIPFENVDIRTQAANIGFVLQNPDNQIVTDKVWHELAFGLESLGMDTPTIRLRVAEMASYFGIQDWFMKNVSELSGGQKQLLNLASVMAMHPEILILDEPTSQLDPIAASDFLETVRKLNRDVGTTIIMTEHRLEDIIPWADQVLVMDKGRIISSGKPSDVGRRLKESGSDMFCGMPTPMRIYAGTDSRQDWPLTVREGRRWLKNEIDGFDDHKRIASAIEQNHKDNEQDTVIQLKDVWFRYERDLPDVVKGLSLDIKRGEIVALVGGNGTGKSTTLNLIGGLKTPYRGTIRLNGKDIRRYRDDELYRGLLGVMPQNPQTLFTERTVEEELYAMIGGKKDKKPSNFPDNLTKDEAVAGIAELTLMKPLMKHHPYDLSGGEQQRLALAKILLLRPQILLMDEPTKGLDNHYKCEFGRILTRLSEHGVTVLMISHDVEFCASYAHRTGLFFQGKLAAMDESHRFFAGNSYYTTAANRMARSYFPAAVTVEEVIKAIKMAKAGEELAYD